MLFKGKTPNSIIYKYDRGFIGNDIFTYRSTDRLGVNSTTATVYITVNAQAPTSTPPPSSTQQLTAKNLTISTNANTPVQITLNGSSPIKGSTLKFSVLTMPLYGNLSKPTYNTVTYTPNAGFSGPDSFTYRGTDDQGINSTIAIVSITVNTPSLPLSSPPTEQSTVNMVTNVSSGTVDQFGIKEIYLTKPGSEQWFMNMNDPNHDNRTDPQTILTKNPDGSWKVTNSAVRFDVFTSSGYHHNLILCYGKYY